VEHKRGRKIDYGLLSVMRFEAFFGEWRQWSFSDDQSCVRSLWNECSTFRRLHLSSIIRIAVEVDTDIDESLMMEAGTELNVRYAFHTDTADRQRGIKFDLLPCHFLF
jgi:hypothetical protein